MSFRIDKSSPAEVPTTDMNTSMKKDTQDYSLWGKSSVACTFERKGSDENAIKMTTGGKETGTAQNERRHSGISPDLTKSDADKTTNNVENMKRSQQLSHGAVSKDDDLDSTDELIFELDNESDDDNLELYLPEKTAALATEKRARDTDLFDSFEALSVETVSAFEKQTTEHGPRYLKQQTEQLTYAQVLTLPQPTTNSQLFENSFEALSVEAVSASLFENQMTEHGSRCYDNEDKSDNPSPCGSFHLNISSKPTTPMSSTPRQIPSRDHDDSPKPTITAGDTSQADFKSVLHDDNKGDISEHAEGDDQLIYEGSKSVSTTGDTHGEDNNCHDETSSLLSSDDYDETDNRDIEDGKISPDLSPLEYMLTVDDLNRFKRSCATASSCSSLSDFGEECSKEVADIMDNTSLSLDSSYSDSEDEDKNDGDDVDYNLLKDNETDTEEPTPVHDIKPEARKSAVGNIGQVSHKHDQNVIIKPRTDKHNNSSRNDTVDGSRNRHESNKSSTRSQAPSASYVPVTHMPLSNFPTPNTHRSNRKKGLREKTIADYHDPRKQHVRTSKLFDPYADRRLSATLPSHLKRYWNFDAPKKVPKENWPALALAECPLPDKPNKEANQQTGQPTYAQVLTTSQPTPKRGYVKKIQKSKTRSCRPAVPVESNVYSPNSLDTGLPCRGEMLVSNSADTVSLNTDGSMGISPSVGSVKQPSYKKGTKHQEPLQGPTQFQDPAIVAVSATFQFRPRIIGLSHGGPTEVQSQSVIKDNLLSLLFRPNIQQEDPAIVGVHRVKQQPVAAIPLEVLEKSMIPKYAQTADTPLRAPAPSTKKNAMFHDPAIIYARQNSVTSLSSSPQSSQTGFWSVQDQENTSFSNNTCVTSNPYVNQKALISSTYWTTKCPEKFAAEFPVYQGVHYLVDSCTTTVGVPSNDITWVTC